MGFLKNIVPLSRGFQNASEIGLQSKDVLKLAKIARLSHKVSHWMKCFFISNVTLFTFCTVLIAYFQDHNVLFAPLLIAFLITFVQSVIATTFVLYWMLLYLLVIYYIILQFRNLSASINGKQIAIKTLTNFAIRFKNICILVADFNKLAKFVQCQTYVLTTLIFCYFFYMSVFGNYELLVRIHPFSAFLGAVLLVLLMNNLCAQVSIEVVIYFFY